MTASIETPVLVIAHRRLDKVRRVVDACIDGGAMDVTVVIDGPRSNCEIGELDAVEAHVREAQWAGSVAVKRRHVNLGVGGSVPTACDYMFLEHKTAIVLEDDCVPTTEFFRYADTALRVFARDPRVGIISGQSLSATNSFMLPIRLSRFPLTWGWASWRDRWVNYRHSLAGWRAQLPIGRLLKELGPVAAFDWIRIFDEHSVSDPYAWDHQIAFMLWTNEQWSVNPSIDLVENIGFDLEASNTSSRPPYAPRVPLEQVRRAWLSDFERMLESGQVPQLDPSYETSISRGIFSPPIMRRLRSAMVRLRASSARESC